MEIKTKYDVGSNVWLIFNNEVKEKKVTRCEISVALTDDEPIVITTYDIEGESVRFDESKLFKTKAELIESL